tara:strand:- start:118 stop:534 length:417 start_codon:yes stop_codon:yes gene_type:complete
MSILETDSFYFNPEELLKIDWKNFSQKLEDEIFNDGRIQGFFPDAENFTIIVDFQYKKNKEGLVLEDWTTIIRTDGANSSDSFGMQEGIQDYIRDNYWEDAIEGVLEIYELNYEDYKEWDVEAIKPAPNYFFEIRKWE